MKEAMMTKESARYWPSSRGSPAMTATPKKAIGMPKARRQPSLSLKKMAASSDAKGTLSWMAIDAVAASMLFSPLNMKEKCSRPRVMEMARSEEHTSELQSINGI